MVLLSSKTSRFGLTNNNRQIEEAFNDTYQELGSEERITINGIDIPLKFSDSSEHFLPSAETISAWYLAHYGKPIKICTIGRGKNLKMSHYAINVGKSVVK